MQKQKQVQHILPSAPDLSEELMDPSLVEWEESPLSVRQTIRGRYGGLQGGSKGGATDTKDKAPGEAPKWSKAGLNGGPQDTKDKAPGELSKWAKGGFERNGCCSMCTILYGKMEHDDTKADCHTWLKENGLQPVSKWPKKDNARKRLFKWAAKHKKAGGTWLLPRLKKYI